jgi:diguanylate cyclase (GGDEF)-like protein
VNDPKLTDEAGRLAALDRYCVLDTQPEAAFDKITALVQAVLNVPICAVSLIARDRQWFKSIQGLDATETPRNIAFCDYTIKTREPLIIAHATMDARFAKNPMVTGAPSIRSYAGVPLQSAEGYNLGALCVIDTKTRDFSASQIEILRNFAAVVVDELELRTIAHNDFLTGTMTRRAFVEAAEKEIDRLKRYRRSSALLMFDIDHFKRVNDEFGHPLGDQVLKAVALCGDGTLRPTDIFGRLGGEEFGVVLSEATLDDAVVVAERLRRCIGQLTFEGAPQLRVTASFGVAALQPGQTFAIWMAAADAALYDAKRGGRDRTVTSHHSRAEPAAA